MMAAASIAQDSGFHMYCQEGGRNRGDALVQGSMTTKKTRVSEQTGTAGSTWSAAGEGRGVAAREHW